METKTNRLRFAELSSSLGAGIAGLGAGVLLAKYIDGLGTSFLAAGLLLHAWGMTDKHAIERRAGEGRPAWSLALYWVCWLAIAALVVVAAVRGLQ